MRTTTIIIAIILVLISLTLIAGCDNTRYSAEQTNNYTQYNCTPGATNESSTQTCTYIIKKNDTKCVG
jgi:hypothetical protein